MVHESAGGHDGDICARGGGLQRERRGEARDCRQEGGQRRGCGVTVQQLRLRRRGHAAVHEGDRELGDVGREAGDDCVNLQQQQQRVNGEGGAVASEAWLKTPRAHERRQRTRLRLASQAQPWLGGGLATHTWIGNTHMPSGSRRARYASLVF